MQVSAAEFNIYTLRIPESLSKNSCSKGVLIREGLIFKRGHQSITEHQKCEVCHLPGQK